ncbi:hypothetical protein NQ314_019300 [Rhamnusium bicolor]|uniref:Transcriptional adapter 1 n=1 Tax=Rhamnusium bicolor TaxID=1586634 RepID=A0AAV8WNZ6_9CUCU|nr:hypothetical protein NQ314_019300 [Rhamnusium bicolor]
MELNEARKNLEACLSEELRREYFALLRQWFLISTPITKDDFDKRVRKFLVTKEQIRCHNDFLLAIISKSRSDNRPKNIRTTNEEGVFECADFSEYVQPCSPPPSDLENRSASAELFMPDRGFIASRIAVIAWENGLEGADENVTDLVVHACQVFVRNIIMAMISRKKDIKLGMESFSLDLITPYQIHLLEILTIL